MKLPIVVINYDYFKNTDYNNKDPNSRFYLSAKAEAEVLTWHMNKGSMRVRLIESEEYPVYRKEMGIKIEDLSDKVLLQQHPKLEIFFDKEK